MSAFNDYCIVCDQLCTSNSAYCSLACKAIEEGITSNSNSSKIDGASSNIPQSYVSPLLQATVSTTKTPALSTNTGAATTNTLQYDSPLLTSTTSPNFDLDSDFLNLSHYESLPRTSGSNKKIQPSSYLSDYLSTTSINYKKWLHSTKATISN